MREQLRPYNAWGGQSPCKGTLKGHCMTLQMKPLAMETLGCWKCQNYGGFAKESQMHGLELPQERSSLSYNQQNWRCGKAQVILSWVSNV